MKLRYKELFRIRFSPAYYVDGAAHNDLTLEPTLACRAQMSRYRLLSRQSPDGISLYYEASPLTNDATPFKPIQNEERFAFRVSIQNPDLWYYADLNGWQQDKLFFIKNAGYNATGDISILNGALNNPVLNRPLKFVHQLPLQTAASVLEIHDATGNLVSSLLLRAKNADEAPGKTEGILIDLGTSSDGLYTLRHIKSGGNTEEQAYCSADCVPGTFAVIEITYKGGAGWTGVAPTQQYTARLAARLTDWVYEIYIRPRPMNTLLASKLFIKHEPVGAEPLQTFSVVVADDAAGYVQFKSNTPLKFSQQARKLRLVTPDLITPVDVISTLPGPSAQSMVKTGPDLSTKIIVNV